MKLHHVLFALAALASSLAVSRADEPMLLDVAEIKRDAPVEFERDVLPILKKNCIACHNATKAENKLNVESPADILRGGDTGPAIVAGRGLESLLLLRARGGGDGPMPPADNKVGAAALTAHDLGLIKLWIDQGAKGSVASATKIDWRPLPASVNPIFAVALTGDGQFAACNRANQAFVYQVPTGRHVCQLVDPAIQAAGLDPHGSVADLDLIQSLAFSPDGQLLASGGYRAIKLWQRPAPRRERSIKLADVPRAMAVSADEKRLAVVTGERRAQLFELPAMKAGALLTGHEQPIVAIKFSSDGALVYAVDADGLIRAWQAADGQSAWQLATGVSTTALAAIGSGQQLAT
ncbi:MAG TPA: c-type cytochrome domain-containing protein, partial [Pirellulales bacterium]|nr:c-type cytochrome domain-containing protein [Pirellulales bacterium]